MTRPSHTMKFVPRRADVWWGEGQLPALSEPFAAVHRLGLEGRVDATVGGAREPQLSDGGDEASPPAPPPVVLVTQVVQWRRS
jgi:hypothetical protein